MNHGLPEAAIRAIHEVFLRHPEVEQAILFGSRAKGSYRHGSDIDLVLSGEYLTFSILLTLINEMDDLTIPHTVDLSLLSRISDLDVLDHIRRVGVIFFDREA